MSDMLEFVDESLVVPPNVGKTQTLPQLEFHTDHPLQWWFIQGSLSLCSRRANKRGADAPDGDFMLSIFRCRLPREHPAAPPHFGYMLLSAFLPSDGSVQTSACHITENLFDYTKHSLFAEARNQAAKDSEEPEESKQQRALFKALAEEMERFGPFAPVNIHHDMAVSEDPLSLKWHGSSICQHEEGLDIHLRLPGDRRHCAFTLIPEAEHLDISGFELDRTALETDLIICPRMRLTGMAEEVAITGQAWFEQQSLGRDWFVEADGYERRDLPLEQVEIHWRGLAHGWQWFGLNLDDGSDIAIFNVLEPCSSKGLAGGDTRVTSNLTSVDGFAWHFTPNEKPRRLRYFNVEALESWDSPVTLARYPVKCRITLPEIDAELVVEAICDNQEIKVFGPQNAIFQGRANVLGRMGSEFLSGRARMENNGHANIANFDDILQRLTDRTDRSIGQFLPRQFDADSLTRFVGPQRWQSDLAAANDMISKPVWDLLDRGGRHWRPIYALLLMQAFGADFSPYEDLLTVLPELVHNGALMVDDVEDGSELRRGLPAIHQKYGIDTAINAGNSLYFLPLTLLIDHPALDPIKRERFFSILTQSFVQAHFGQAQDLSWAHRSVSDIRKALVTPKTCEMILQAYAQKTAAEITSIARLVSVILELPEDKVTILTSFSEGFGVAFQIVDDVNNFSPHSKWGKSIGEDLITGKPTYVICRAAQSMEGEDQAFMLDLMTDQDRQQDPNQIAKAIALINASGALRQCRKEAKQMLQAEWQRLDPVLSPSLAKICLKMLCNKLLDHLG